MPIPQLAFTLVAAEEHRSHTGFEVYVPGRQDAFVANPA
jgi:hypothetical protein